MQEQQNQSEVAHLRERIEREHQASWGALKGLAAGIARHAFINARLRRMDRYYGKLAQMVGEEQATEYLCEVFEEKETEQ